MLPHPTRLRYALSRHDWPLVGLLFLAYLLYLPTTGYAALPFDAGKYWTLAERFFQAGHFQLLAYDDSLRGYLLALLNLPAKAVVHFTSTQPLAVTRVLGAATAALLFGWAGPALWRALVPTAPLSFAARLAFAALGFLFWRDYFNFPLSDFPALLALVVSLGLVLRPGPAWRLVAAGALLAAAINIRPVYLIAAPALVGLAAWEAPGAWRRGVVVAALALGFALISLPQLLMNGRHYQHWSPLVLSRDARFPAASLYLSQLGWGLVIQKYETTLDPAAASPRMLYVDPAGQALLREEAIRHFPSYGAYLRELVHRPLSFAALYGRHLFNGLDVQYPSPYIRQVADRPPALALLHYSVWFGALVGLWQQRRHWLRPRPLLAGAALLAPAFVSIPVAIECRFLLPLHLLLYAVFCFSFWPNLRPALRWSRRVQLLLVGAYGLFLLGCVTLSAHTRTHLTADLSVLAPLGGDEQ